MPYGPYRLQFLHISDLHAKGPREREPWRRRRVPGDTWRRHLETLLQEEGLVHFVFFTGDAAQSGKPDEYAEVTDFLHALCDELGVAMDRLFVVPGNHDIDRDVQRPVWESMRMRLAASTDLLGISRRMNGLTVSPPLGFDHSWKQAILERERVYREWVQGALRADLAPEGLGYRFSINLPGWTLPIHIVGLDTAWLCGDDADTGKLLATENQLGAHLTTERGESLPGPAEPDRRARAARADRRRREAVRGSVRRVAAWRHAMSTVREQLPGAWWFTWLFWMQPITLHRLLNGLGLDLGKVGWKLYRHRTPAENCYLIRLAQMSMISLAFSFAVAFVLQQFGAPVSWRYGYLVVAVGLLAGVVWFALNVTFGFAGLVTVMVAFGVGFVVMGGITTLSSVAASVVVSAAGIFAVAVSIVVSSYVTDGFVPDFTEGALLGSLEFLFALTRLPVFVLESLAEAGARTWIRVTGARTLNWVPALYHELSYLPLPLLEGHLLVEADADRELTRRVLDACAVAPGQRRIGRTVEATLRARELTRLVEARDFQAIAELRGTWLPGIQGADGVLLGFSEAARYLAAATTAFNPHHQLTHLKGFAAQINALENQLRSGVNSFTGFDSRLTQAFHEPMRALQRAGQILREEIESRVAGLIPNPFRAGDPLSGEAGPELFRGRERAIRDIEEILSDPDRSASLQLLAPRRSGKTSLLKMLPGMLPDAVCVFFDLQAHPAASVDRFLQSVAEQAQVQAKRDRRIELPPMPDGPPLEAAEKWLDKLEHLPDGRRVLIAIDEFERLEDLFPGSRREFLQLMGLFRATIQHRQRVRLLVSGAAAFDSLDRVWDDHFISARQIKLPFLDQSTSIGLLSAPSSDFPAGAIPGDVAADVYRRTGGQPYLLQIFGSLLVGRLNHEKRRAATVADVEAIEGRALEWAEGYFRDLYRWAPEPVRAVLGCLARGETAAITPPARRWLERQYLLTPDDRLAVPLLGKWIEHHALV
jgi:hypothetical protein